MNAIDERGLPENYQGCLPRAYDRRAQPRPEVLDEPGYERKLLEDLQAMRARVRAKESA
jgi:hypothetical protein